MIEAVRRRTALLCLSAGLLGVLALRSAQQAGQPLGWDRWASSIALREGDWRDIAGAVTQLGNGWAVYPILIALGALQLRRGIRLAVAGAPVLVLLAGQITRTLLAVPIAGSRPALPFAEVDGPAFSSGHAMTATLGWALVAMQVSLLARPRRVGPVCAAAAASIAVAVGLSRAYLNVHWASDVLGGWACGVALAAVSVPLLRKLYAGERLTMRLPAALHESPLAWLLPVAATGVALLPLLLEGSARLKDLLVYHGAAGVALHGGDVYAFRTAFDMPFTYPPAGALLAMPLALLPLWSVQVLWTAATVAALVPLALVALRPAVARIGLPLVLTALLLSTPVRSDIRFGQVGVFLVLLVAVDLLHRRTGVGTGIAAAVKLTPLVYVPWLLWTDRRLAWRTVGWTAAASLAGALVLWPSTVSYVSTAFWDNSRFGLNDIPGNQSMRGMLLRADIHPGVWPLMAVVLAVVGVVQARRLDQRGNRLGAIGVLAALSVAVSPISWVHHLVWLCLPIAALVQAGRHRIALGWAGLLAIGLPALGAGALAVTPGQSVLWHVVIDAQGLTAVTAVVLLPRLLKA